MKRVVAGGAAIASCLMLSGVLFACAPLAATDASDATGSATETEATDGEVYGKGGPLRPGWIAEGGLNETGSEEALDAYQQTLVDRENEAATKYAPEVKTLADGTQIQKTPQDDRYWNIASLDADNRGCTSCHSLEEAIANTPIAHASLKTVGTTELNVYACKGCHTDLRARLWGDNIPLSDAVHTAHLRSEYFQGDCFSCHEQDADGNMRLWEDVKWDVLRGTTDVANVSGDFSFDQNVVLPLEDCFYRENDNASPSGTLLGGEIDLKPYDDAFYDNMVIKVEGDVNNPFEISLANTPEDELVTRVMRSRCEIDGNDSGLISNFELTGIDLGDLVEKADPKEGVNSIHFKVLDDEAYYAPWPLDWALSEQNANAMLALKINGEKLTPAHGFPATVFWGPYSCGVNMRHVYAIELVHVDEEELYLPSMVDMHGVHAPEDEKAAVYSPSVAVTNVYDGQIFQAGETDTLSFEGYADAFDDPIVAVEFSLDGGTTWSRYETPDTTNDRWVYWHYDIPAMEPGSYVLTMRAEAASGAVSPRESKLLFHIQ